MVVFFVFIVIFDFVLTFSVSIVIENGMIAQSMHGMTPGSMHMTFQLAI